MILQISPGLVPTIVFAGYPANILGTKGHHWGDAIAMARHLIAHKGSLAGAKATALNIYPPIHQSKIFRMHAKISLL
jgi:hypothetical protein